MTMQHMATIPSHWLLFSRQSPVATTPSRLACRSAIAQRRFAPRPPPGHWLCFRPAGPAISDLSPCYSSACVNSNLASFGAFCGVFTPQGRLCRTPALRPGRSVGSVPSWDRSPILSFVESSMTASQLCPTTGPELPTAIGSLLCPSSQPLAPTSHGSSAIGSSPPAIESPPPAIRHLAFVICHLTFAICHFSFLIPHSAFRLPHSPFRTPPSAFSEAPPASAAAPASWPTGTAGGARTPGCNPALRGRPKWGPLPLR